MISSEPWGAVDGIPVDLFTLSSGAGLMVKVATFGGLVQSIRLPDRSGGAVNVALGFSSLEEYVEDVAGPDVSYFGAIIGRYANRIAPGPFQLDGSSYSLEGEGRSADAVTLHGGRAGYHARVWQAEPVEAGFGDGVRLSYVDRDGANGFPGTVSTEVVYTVTRDNALRISYRARTDAPTVVNLTNHTYFNLAGEGSGDVYDQLLAINARVFQPVDAAQIPVGFAPVEGTPFDFRAMKPLGRDVRASDLPMGGQLEISGGYDQNWVLSGAGYRLAAVAWSAESGVGLWAFTDQPGLQMYTANHLADLIGTGGRAYRAGSAFALETQRFPDSPHHIGEPGWPAVVLRPGEVLRTSTAYKFALAGSELAERVRF